MGATDRVLRGIGYVHKATVAVCVRVPADGRTRQHVQTFGTMTAICRLCGTG